jgi:hypothetical protein
VLIRPIRGAPPYSAGASGYNGPSYSWVGDMTKVRVYELAKEFGVESKVVLARLNDIGEFVRSASSTLEAPVVQKLKAAMETATTAGTADHDFTKTSQALGIDPHVFRRQKRRPESHRKSRRPDDAISRNGQIDEVAAIARWASRWIDKGQMLEWRKGGLGIYDDAKAAECIAEGITPDQLGIRIDGQTIASRLRGGESVSSVVARLRAIRDQ